MAAQEESEPVLVTSVHDVRYFVTLLRGIHFANRATVIITGSGCTITVEEARTVLATAYVFKDVFDEYAYHPEPSATGIPASPSSDFDASQDPDQTNNATFEVPLNILIDCLNIFGSAGVPPSALGPSGMQKRWRRADDGSDRDDDGRFSASGGGGRNGFDRHLSGALGEGKRTGMRMKYVGSGHPLTLLLAEESNGPTTTCEITTFNSEPQLDLPFDSNQTVLKVILKSSWLRDALSELDPSCDKLVIIGNPPPLGGRSRAGVGEVKPILRLQASGNFGSAEMDYPNDREVLETVECVSAVRFSYRFAHITRALRALQLSTKTSLRIDNEGLLSLQFLMPRNGLSGKPVGSDAFIEFRCLALDEEL